MLSSTIRVFSSKAAQVITLSLAGVTGLFAAKEISDGQEKTGVQAALIASGLGLAGLGIRSHRAQLNQKMSDHSRNLLDQIIERLHELQPNKDYLLNIGRTVPESFNFCPGGLLDFDRSVLKKLREDGKALDEKEFNQKYFVVVRLCAGTSQIFVNFTDMNGSVLTYQMGAVLIVDLPTLTHSVFDWRPKSPAHTVSFLRSLLDALKSQSI